MHYEIIMTYYFENYSRKFGLKYIKYNNRYLLYKNKKVRQ